MTPDQAIERRRAFSHWNYGDHLPQATVIASEDWLSYVEAMTDSVPQGEQITYPTEDEARWAWPEGVVVLFDRPVMVEHVIRSQETVNGFELIEPEVERQPTHALIIRTGMAPMRGMDGKESHEPVPALYYVHVGEDLSSPIVGHLVWGWDVGTNLSHIGISHSTRWMIALITALGHRLTDVATVGAPDRPMQKRWDRAALGPFRVLRLATPDRATSSGGTRDHDHRWMVRGHWRLQPHGPGRTLRRLQWIDPYVKGPDDAPLDVRPTIWKAGTP